jgi:hypothetical protein
VPVIKKVILDCFRHSDVWSEGMLRESR